MATKTTNLSPILARLAQVAEVALLLVLTALLQASLIQNTCLKLVGNTWSWKTKAHGLHALHA